MAPRYSWSIPPSTWAQSRTDTGSRYKASKTVARVRLNTGHTGYSASCRTSTIRITKHDIPLFIFQETLWNIIMVRSSQRLIRTKISQILTVQKPTWEDGGTMSAILPTLTASICGENQSLALELIGRLGKDISIP